MKQYFLKSLFFIAYYIGVINLFYFITRKRQRVITYHNIISDQYFNNTIEQSVSCSESVFKIQLREIASRFNFTTEIDKQKSCIITFDDGYQNNYSIALPVLDLYGIKAIFFISYNLPTKQKALWIDLVMNWYSYVPEGEYTVLGDSINILDKNRKGYFSKILSKIYKDYSIKEHLLISLDDAFNFNQLLKDETYNRIRFSPISLIEIQKIKSDNHLVACHTISHDILSKLSEDLLKSEIQESEKYINTFYNTNYFAYPFGGVNEVSDTVLRSYSTSKFKKCFVNYWNFENSHGDERLQRISLPNTTNKYVIHAYLSGFYFYFKKRIIHE